jgi:signal transduction histidine kinase
VTVRPGIPAVICDRDRLRQVFENLLANALKYGRPASGPMHVTIGGEAQGDAVRLFVADNGPGVPTEHRERVFGLFERLHTDSDGSGVGLAIVRRVAEVHGGHAWIEATPGGGATFCVALPAAAATTWRRLAA